MAKVLGVSWEPLKGGFGQWTYRQEGQKRYELANDIVILDETYNAGLESMIAALKIISRDTPGKRHIAVVRYDEGVGRSLARVSQTSRRDGTEIKSGCFIYFGRF